MPLINSKSKPVFAFSLIEVILIVAMVAVVFVGVMSLTTRSLQMENVIKNDFIAQGLLREGVELAEAMRNENVVGSISFASGLISTTTAPCDTGPCAHIVVFDWTNVPTSNRATVSSTQITPALASLFPATSTARLKLSADIASTTPSFYQRTSGSDTPFYRYFEVSYDPNAPDSKKFINVIVKVYWEERGKGHTSQVLSRLYDTN
ncbi:hypothetical protein GW935_00380 [Candidatus Falkowbacteria bacterium]|nr:hypothetical protein [Candidatus Falkowbacteria bacterium]